MVSVFVSHMNIHSWALAAFSSNLRGGFHVSGGQDDLSCGYQSTLLSSCSSALFKGLMLKADIVAGMEVFHGFSKMPFPHQG